MQWELRGKPFALEVLGRQMAKEDDDDALEAAAEVQEGGRLEAVAFHLAMEEGDVVPYHDGPKNPGEVLGEEADADGRQEDFLVAAEVVVKDPRELASNNHRLMENCCTHERQPTQKLLDKRSPSQLLLFSPFPNLNQHLQLS